jgi:hypothetical protein
MFIAAGVLALGPSVLRAQFDEPDLDLEGQLFNTYKKFHSQRTSNEAWNSASAERQAETYQIQTGDTLWDISGTFFGDGNYWPKVWSLNGQITNPHLIRPGNNIRFLLGNESAPPTISVTEADGTETPTPDSENGGEADQVGVTETADSGDGASDSAALEPDIPPPTRRSRPPVKRIPPSLPSWQTQGSKDEYDELGIDYGRRRIADIQETLPLGSYIVEDKIPALGEVSEVEVGSRIASALQYVYVLTKPGGAQIGETLLAVRDLGPVQSVHASIKGFLGNSVEVQGELQLVEKIANGTAKGGQDLYRAIVSRVVNPVSVGAVLVKDRISYVNLRDEGKRSQVVAQIIGGQLFSRRQVHAPEAVAYLNRGSDAGLESGTLLSIRENRSVRNSETAVTANVRPIGWLKVVRVTPKFATAIVIKSWSDVLTGDVTGAGEISDGALSERPFNSDRDSAEGNADSLEDEFKQ